MRVSSNMTSINETIQLIEILKNLEELEELESEEEREDAKRKYWIIFKKYLSTQQWISLIILTVGCMLKQVQFGTDTAENNAIETTNTPPHINKNMVGLDFSINAVFIIAQTVCSCLAGVYNEYLLKDKGSDVNIFVQNVFMHTDSILCNSVILLVQGGLTDAFTPNNLYSIFRFNVIIIIVNNTAIGIVTSFFLKYMNSILKTFASALELVFTAILCYILFSIPIYLNTIISIAVVSFAIYLYSQSPVVNLGKIKMRTGNNSDTRRLLLEAYKVEETV